MIQKNGTFVVPNLYLVEAIDLDQLPPMIRAKEEYPKPLIGESYRRALRMGLKVAFGTDAGVHPHGDNAKEFGDQVELGLLADVIAVRGNPLEDIRELEQVTFLMKGGKVDKHEN